MSERDNAELAVIKEKVNALHNRLIGSDGTGGELDSLDKRVSKLENWRWWVVGIAIGLGFAIGWNGNSLAEVLLK